MSRDHTNEEPVHSGQEHELSESLIGSSFSFEDEPYLGFSPVEDLADSSDD
jgi:hypothetical protein